MRHQHMIGEAAGFLDAERARPVAEMLVAALADGAGAAADPGIDDAPVAWRDAGGIGPAATTSPAISWPKVIGVARPRSLSIIRLPPPSS